MKRSTLLAIVILLAQWALVPRVEAQRINQEGRILGTLPVVTNSILFDTNNADTVVSAMQIFPVTNPWNECISNLPVLPNSDAMIAQIIKTVGSHLTLDLFQEMNFVLVPDSQPLVPEQFVDYADQSDLNGGTSPYGLYPIPPDLPIEGWPTQTGAQTLQQWQTNNTTGEDRHSIIVQPGAGFLFETWETLLVGTDWQAANGAIFNLNSNGLRPDGWTSGDAAGFPMFPALVRYDECQRGMVEHACRLEVPVTRAASIYPATHEAGAQAASQTNYPAMGQRLRLKAGFVIPANWTQEERALLLGLKKYGFMVADNSSSFFSMSITPDDRWGNAFADVPGAIGITNFEVVQTTGPDGGPRSPGAPVANAGPNQTVLVGVPVVLQGSVAFSNPVPVIQWTLYSGPGPGTVQFGNAALTNTTASFNAPGVYTLELSAADGVHAVAYAVVTLTATNAISLTLAPAGPNLHLTWQGGSAPYVVQQTPFLPATAWTPVATTSVQTLTLPITNQTEFFRVQSP
jgi:hypothetical protein